MLRRALIGFPRGALCQVAWLLYGSVQYNVVDRSPPVSFTICRRTNQGRRLLVLIVHDSPTAMEALHVSTAPEQDFRKLINDLFTECTRCKCEIRVREMINNSSSPLLCPKCRLLPKVREPWLWAFLLWFRAVNTLSRQPGRLDVRCGVPRTGSHKRAFRFYTAQGEFVRPGAPLFFCRTDEPWLPT